MQQFLRSDDESRTPRADQNVTDEIAAAVPSTRLNPTDRKERTS
jgi:hypothetical protein